MSDDSFIREVDEELRSERVQDVWKKYGKLMIAGAAAVVIGTAGYRGYQYYNAQKAASAGDSFMEAVLLSNTGKTDDALKQFQSLKDLDSPAYASLASLRIASDLAKSGDAKGAVAAYDAVAADTSADQNLRSIARLRAAMLLVDSGTVTEVEARVGPLTGPGGAYKVSAQEALALAYYKAGDLPKSAKLFDEIIANETTPRAIGQRAQLLRELIASQGGPVVKK